MHAFDMCKRISVKEGIRVFEGEYPKIRCQIQIDGKGIGPLFSSIDCTDDVRKWLMEALPELKEHFYAVFKEEVKAEA